MTPEELKALGKELTPGRMERASIPWKHLAPSIADGEKVLGIFACKFEGLQGGCVVTDQRLLVVGGGSLGALRKTRGEIDLDVIAGVRSSDLYVEVGDVQLAMVPRAQELVRLINQVRRRPAQSPAEHAAPDAADALAKLASLRDAGVLTEEEFSAKKAELLDRI